MSVLFRQLPDETTMLQEHNTSETLEADEEPCTCQDFARINAAALARSRELIVKLLPNGMGSGAQYVIPIRDKRRLISIFPATGRWAAFDVVDSGSDLISLIAFVDDMSRCDAAGLIAAVLKLDAD